jgi:hypothetical protein
MTSRIIIEIDDEHQRFGVYWPDGTGHTYKLSPPQTEHSIKNRIADEINRMMLVPEICSGAGELQYSLPNLERLCKNHNVKIDYFEGHWRAKYIDFIFEFESRKHLVDFLNKLEENT